MEDAAMIFLCLSPSYTTRVPRTVYKRACWPAIPAGTGARSNKKKLVHDDFEKIALIVWYKKKKGKKHTQ